MSSYELEMEMEGILMETFQLTRKDMSQLLISLTGQPGKSPKAILREIWLKSRREQPGESRSFDAYVGASISPILAKVMEINPAQEAGLSLSDIVALGGQIEYNHFAVTAVQNWVKRDLKEIIGSPRLGKKYSFQQAAILFIIEDLRAALDLESIRKLLLRVFRHCDSDADDLIHPVDFYAAYSGLFEELDPNNDQVLDLPGSPGRDFKHDHLMEALVKKKADDFAASLPELSPQEREAVRNCMVIAMLSVQTAYFQSLAKRYFQASMFLQNL